MMVIRLFLALVGIVTFGVGLVLLAGGGAGAWAGLWPLLLGGGLICAIALEHQRYRSQAAERAREAPGPGGGEPTAPVPPFRPTDERFVDPTTGAVMRVFLDPATGERRYRAEGDVAAGARS